MIKAILIFGGALLAGLIGGMAMILCKAASDADDYFAGKENEDGA